MDRNLALEVVRVTEAAALASARFVGLGDRDGADRAATEAMRATFGSLHIRGTVVIGEGERDEAPMLYIGEEAGARIRLISDGDVGGAIATSEPDTGIDVLMGIGGAPEGVLAAAALRCVNGDMQGVLKPRNQEEIARAAKMGITDIAHIFSIE